MPSGDDGGRHQRQQRPTPPPAVNEPLTFINFVAAFPVGSTIEGEVVSFTSHGAMVDVPLPGGGALHCYIPLTAMGTPPPTKARQVLKKGEVRSFVLAGLDPPRRVAELAIAPPAAKRSGATKAVPGCHACAHREGGAGGQEGGGEEGGRTGQEGGEEGRDGGQEGSREEGGRAGQEGGEEGRQEGGQEGGQGQEGAGEEGCGQEDPQGGPSEGWHAARDGAAPAGGRPSASAALSLRQRTDRGRSRRLRPGAMGADR